MLDPATSRGLPPFLARGRRHQLRLHARPVHRRVAGRREPVLAHPAERRHASRPAATRRTTSRWAGTPSASWRGARQRPDGPRRRDALRRPGDRPAGRGRRAGPGQRRPCTRPSGTVVEPMDVDREVTGQIDGRPDAAARPGGRRRAGHRPARLTRRDCRRAAIRSSSWMERGWCGRRAARSGRRRSLGSRGARCGCCTTTSTPRWPSGPTTWSSTAAPGGPRGTGGASTRSSSRCGRWRRTTRCWSSRASRSACVRTTEQAPRVLIANSLLVPKWATPEHFRELEDAGLMMYGQMTAGSWIYIGTQGILQGTYATFAEVANQHFGGTLAGTVTLTGRPGRHGRRPAAGGDRQRRRGAVRRGRPGAGAAPARRAATSTRSPTPSTTASRGSRRPSGSGARCRSR